MKKYNILIITIFIISALYSCNYLDVVPDDIATVDYAFRDRDRAQRYLATCYSGLPKFGDHRSNPAMNGGDEIWFTSEPTDRGNGKNLERCRQNVDNSYYNFWQGLNGGTDMYQAIRNCNVFLNEIGSVPDITAEERDRWIAEVKFLKAFYHFYLIRMYGPIPLMDKNIEVSASIEAAKPFRDPLDTCFNYVVRLLDQAAATDPQTNVSYLPDFVLDPISEMGRITRPIVLAIKAQVLITAASPLYNGDDYYKDVVDSRGIHLFPQTSDPAKWEKAKLACDEAIKACQVAGLRILSPDQVYNGIPVTALTPILPYMGTLSNQTKLGIMLRSIVTERWNSEIIWGSPATTDNYSFQINAIPHLNQPNSGNQQTTYGAPFKIAAEFYTKNGLPLDEDKTWDYAGRFNLRTVTPEYKYYLINGEQTIKFNFDREPRYYAWLGFDRGVWFGQGVYNDTVAWNVRMRLGEPQFSPSVIEYSSYFPKKLVNMQCYWASATSGLTMVQYSFPVIRLGELYLYYAEALNETGDITNAQAWVDKIRVRAGLSGVADSWTNFSNNPNKPTTQAGMRKIIQDETLIEMSFEGARFWDSRRWKLCEQQYSTPVQLWDNTQSTALGYYTLKTLFQQTFSARDYLWPIPKSEVNINPNLVQNKGW
jgi:starch-binding outer membrane protein, SusD/RagB family